MNIDEIVKRIEFFRKKKKLSSRELSDMIGKHAGYINKLELEDFNLPTTMLLNIISALEVEEEEFFAKNYKTYYIDKDLYNTIIKLPEEKKKSLSDFLKK